MVESVDTQDLKSCGHCGCAGSSPAPGTCFNRFTITQTVISHACSRNFHSFPTDNFNAQKAEKPQHHRALAAWIIWTSVPPGFHPDRVQHFRTNHRR